MQPSDLHVIIPFNNPMRWRARLANMRRCEEGILAAGVSLTTVEMAYGDHDFDLPYQDGIKRCRVRGKDILWQKENLGNIGVAANPNAEYVALVDGDALFVSPDWPMRTLYALQTFRVVQMASHVVFLGPDEEFRGRSDSYVKRYRERRAEMRASGLNADQVTFPPGPFPGLAWAYRRETFERMGRFLDVCIVGSGDFHMCCAILGMPDYALMDEKPARRNSSPGYARALRAWRDTADRAVNRSVGYVKGTICHYWHGRIEDRKYGSDNVPGRWTILEKNQYDPYTDIHYDDQGVLRLNGNKLQLREDLIEYFGGRNEDSIDVRALDQSSSGIETPAKPETPPVPAVVHAPIFPPEPPKPEPPKHHPHPPPRPPFPPPYPPVKIEE